MTVGRRIAARVSVLVFATALVLGPGISRAAPGCNPSDLYNSIKNAGNALDGSACSAACTDGAGCVAAGVIATALGGAATSGGQGLVDSFCNDISGAVGTSNNAQSDVNSVKSGLQKLGISADIIDNITSALGTVGSVLGVGSCGCAIEQSLAQVDAAASSCVQDALCWGDQLTGDPCTCTPVPPQQANCTLSPTACGTPGDTTPGCADGTGLIQGSSIHQVDDATGTYVSTGGDSQDAAGNCSAVRSCFCPKPYVPTWQVDMPVAYANGDSANSTAYHVFTCGCPAGSSWAGTAGGLPVCLCDGTNQPIQPGNPAGMCAPPACPAGSVRTNGVCVPTCASKHQILLANGQCCDPAQTTSCGECCAPGFTPDTATGSCVKLSTVKVLPVSPGGKP